RCAERRKVRFKYTSRLQGARRTRGRRLDSVAEKIRLLPSCRRGALHRYRLTRGRRAAFVRSLTRLRQQEGQESPGALARGCNSNSTVAFVRREGLPMTTPAASTAAPPALDGHQGLAAPAAIDEAPTAAGTAWPTAACSDQAVRATSEGLQGPLNSTPPTALDVEHDPGKMPATHRQASASSPSVGSSADQAAKKREHAQASA
ncbi:unnamed protein product, partial [Scytosiphon promiscuus]